MSKFIPAISRHLCRPTTKASARRTVQRMAASADAPTQSDLVNPVGGGGGTATAHGALIVGGSAVVAGAGSAIVSFTTADFDTDTFFSGGAPTKLTIPTTGLYLLETKVGFNALAGPDGIGIGFLKNGSSVPGVATLFDVNADLVGFSPNQQVVGLAMLTAGDYVQVTVSSSSTGQTVNAGELSASFLGTP